MLKSKLSAVIILFALMALLPRGFVLAVNNPSYTNTGGTGDRTSLISGSATGNYHPNVGVLYNANFTPGEAYFDSGNANTTTITFDFGSNASKLITEFKWYQNTTDSNGTWKMQGSNNNTDYTDIGNTFTLGGATQAIIDQISSNNTGYRYYKLVGVSGTLSGAWLEEIEFKIDDFQASSGTPATSSTTTSTLTSISDSPHIYFYGFILFIFSFIVARSL